MMDSRVDEFLSYEETPAGIAYIGQCQRIHGKYFLLSKRHTFPVQFLNHFLFQK